MELPLEVLGLLVIGAGSLIVAGLERVFPYTPGQAWLRRGFFLDLVGYGLIQSYVLGVVISWVVHALDEATGLGARHLVRDWPIIAQLVLFVVVHDLYIYGFHRWMHRSALLWRFHEAHHSVEEVDWVAGARSHPVEILINQTVEWLPMILLGASPEVAVWKGVISALWGNFIHANLDVRLGWLQYVINGPQMHRWHHARDLPWPGRNFATKLALWDFVFGTALYDPEQKPRAYGLDEPGFPQTYWGQVAQAFRGRAPALREPLTLEPEVLGGREQQPRQVS